MKIPCPKCGEIITLNGIGRKRLAIPFNNVSKCLRWHFRGHWSGQPHFLNTSKKILELFGIKVSAGFVQWRLQEEAVARGITYDDLVKSLAAHKEVGARQKHIIEKFKEEG